MKTTKKLTFYEVNPRYFKDNSGNGIGDLAGLAAKFDYFKYLGIDAIILQDVLSVDGNDKNKSFTDVASEIGSINDLVKVISLAKKYNKKLLIELKVGSIAENNNWFKSAMSPDVEEFKDVVELHVKKESDTLEYKLSKDNKQYYVVDSKTQEVPLNWRAEQTHEQFTKVIRFWTDLGIDGFVFKDFEFVTNVEKTEMMSESTLKELRKFYRTIKEINDDIIVVGKTDILPLDSSVKYIEGPTKVFDFFMSTQISKIGLHKKFGADLIGKFSANELADAIKVMSSSSSNILSFGSKHVGRILSRWGNDGQFANESAKALGMLLLLSKASASIYYGDEIGMPNIGLTHLDDFQDKEIKERKRVAMNHKVSEKEFMDAQVLQGSINARALMAWNDQKNGGFSVAEKTVTPASSSFKEVNVETQFGDQNSILSFYKDAIKLLSGVNGKVLVHGKIKVSSLIPGIIKVTSTYEDKQVIVVVNTTDSRKTLLFKPKDGKVILSTIPHKAYEGAPSKMEAFEGVVITKRLEGVHDIDTSDEIDEENKKAKEVKTIIANKMVEKTMPVKLEKTSEVRVAKAKTQEVKLPKSKTQEIKLEKTKTMEVKLEKTKTQEVKVSKTKTQDLKFVKSRTQEIKVSNSSLDAEKAKALNERIADRAHKDEVTKLTEDQLAKTTLIDDNYDIQDLFEQEEKRRKK